MPFPNANCDIDCLSIKAEIYPATVGSGQVQIGLFREFDTKERRDVINCNLKIIVDALNQGLSGFLGMSSIADLSPGVQTHSNGAGVPVVTTLKNIYSSNGTLTGDRILDGDGNALLLGNLSLLQLQTSGSPGQITLDASGGVAILSTLTQNDANDNVLVINGSTGVIEQRDATTISGGSAVNIYNTNGTLTGARTVTGSSNALTFTGIGAFTISSTTLVLTVPAGGITLTNAPTSASDTTVLTRASGGGLTSRTAQSVADLANTLYSANGTLAADRTVTGNSKSLTISGVNVLTLGAGTVTVSSTSATSITAGTTMTLTASGGTLALNASGGSYQLVTVPPTSAGPSDKLLVRNTTTGAIEVRDVSTLTNLYNANGTLSGARTVTGGSNALTFTGLGAYSVSSTTVSVTGSSTFTASGTTMTISATSGAASLTGSTTAALTGTASTATITAGTNIVLTAGSNVVRLTNAPATGSSNAKLLTRNASTGDIELRDVSTLPSGGSGLITAIADTTTVDLVETSGTLTANIKFASDAGNQAKAGTGGVFVAGGVNSSAITGGANEVTALTGANSFSSIGGTEAQYYIDVDTDSLGGGSSLDLDTVLTGAPSSVFGTSATLNPFAYFSLNNTGASQNMTFTDHNGNVVTAAPGSRLTFQYDGTQWFVS